MLGRPSTEQVHAKQILLYQVTTFGWNVLITLISFYTPIAYLQIVIIGREQTIMSNIDIENAAAIFHASDMHNAQSLREMAMNFIL